MVGKSLDNSPTMQILSDSKIKPIEDRINSSMKILESFGSPIYSTSDGPYWSQRTGFQQSYVGGYGHILPSTHYETFGSGFSRLPQELGGSIQGGAGGRMGGGRE